MLRSKATGQASIYTVHPSNNNTTFLHGNVIQICVFVCLFRFHINECNPFPFGSRAMAELFIANETTMDVPFIQMLHKQKRIRLEQRKKSFLCVCFVGEISNTISW